MEKHVSDTGIGKEFLNSSIRTQEIIARIGKWRAGGVDQVVQHLPKQA
jgi:hypothetical protein